MGRKSRGKGENDCSRKTMRIPKTDLNMHCMIPLLDIETPECNLEVSSLLVIV